jgi:hypothetical protein
VKGTIVESNRTDTIDERLAALDLSLFERIPSQSGQGDKRSLLACQRFMRNRPDGYVYLEIGSYLGGSLQPHLVDERCPHIYSIDKRPATQPEARGSVYEYQHNSTQRMLDNLRQIDTAAVGKITCIDADARAIDPARINPKPQFCFIDGEHTDEAVFSEFQFCLSVLDTDGIIAFHDAPIVYRGLRQVMQYLQAQGATFRAYALPDMVFLIEFNGLRLHESPYVSETLLNNHITYLAALNFNDGYRVFATKPIFQALRHLKAKFTRKNVFD